MSDPRLALASPEDFNIPTCIETADEAIAMIKKTQEQWRARSR
jgi:hypothetical protein